MKKSDLVNGAIVKLRNGNKYMLLFDTNGYNGREDLLINVYTGGYIRFCEYNEDLTSVDKDRWHDIVAAFQTNYVGDNFKKHIITNEDTWTWKRKETKEMTVEEISKELGYDVKVVK